jgi:fumarate hydratase class II
MHTPNYRIEKDSMGEVQVPEHALYGAQTARAVENFPLSGLTMPQAFIRALGLVKQAAAQANFELKLLDEDKMKAISHAAQKIAQGHYYADFPIDIFQTGSGTSTNMNANEVIARLAKQESGLAIHANDHVNMSQSSNDVIPTTIHVSSNLLIHEKLLPALKHIQQVLHDKADSLKEITKTGRTHLMDAMPVRFDQTLRAFQGQLADCEMRIRATLPRLNQLALGGTAVGTGINAHPEFGQRVAQILAKNTQIDFVTSQNYFVQMSSQDTAVELSGQLKVLAVTLTKIANDLRWMNSGPLAGLSEIALPDLQPGSSIMPGKVNPVIPEAVCMICAQVMGNDMTITIGGQAGNFELNVMLPVIAYNLLQSIELLSNSCTVLADKAIKDFTVNTTHIKTALDKNPILVTALNRVIGYEKGAAIAKRAYKENKSVKELALEMTDLSADELDKLLDPSALTEGGIK